MNSRIPGEDESQFALWTFSHQRRPRENRRVLVAHQERPVGESMSRLLTMKGLQSAFTDNIDQLCELMRAWSPGALLIDTRLDDAPDYALAKRCRAISAREPLLLIAMSNADPLEPVEALKLAGFDGHFRRPGETWRMIDALTTFMEYSAMSRR